jgi:CubicO group peptidase (beta-lactamase class C family)
MKASPDYHSIEEKIGELTDLARQKMGKYHVPGLAIGLSIAGKDYVVCLGVASIDNPLPVTDTTLFQIGSTGKTLTTTALLRLVEAGKLALEDRVRKFIPGFKVMDENAAAGATVHNLLNHTAGWVGDHFVRTGNGADSMAKYAETMASLPQVSPLGWVFAYNNASFALAGRVIEVVTGKPYEDVIREMVLEPLEMTNSFYTPMEIMVHRFAAGHGEFEGKTIVATPWGFDRNMAPAGGMSSDVRDQLKYARFHMGGGVTAKGERILSPESMQLMQTPTHIAGMDGQMAMNWFIKDIEGVRIVAHGGATNGQKSEFWMVPARQFAFTSLTNHNEGGRLNHELSLWIQEHFLGVIQDKPVPQPLPHEKLAEFAAEFVQGGIEAVEKFEVVEGGLLLTEKFGDISAISAIPPEPTPPQNLKYCGSDNFVFIDGPARDEIVEFLRDATGRIGWIRFGGRVLARKN